MGILNLPPETFKQIVQELICSEGIAGAWKYRLLSRAFAGEIFDIVFNRTPLSACHHRKDKALINSTVESRKAFLLGHTKFHLSADDFLPNKIKEILEVLRQDNDQVEETECIDKLCTCVAVHLGNILPILVEAPGDYVSELAGMALRPEDRLAISAALNDEDSFRSVLPQVSRYRISSRIFGGPLSIAGHFGHIGIVKQFGDYLHTVRVTEKLSRSEIVYFAGNTITDGIVEAIQRKNHDIVTALTQLYGNHIMPTKAVYEKWLLKAAIEGDTQTQEIILGVKLRADIALSRETFTKLCKSGAADIIAKLIQQDRVRLNIEYPWKPYSMTVHTALDIVMQCGHADVLTAALEAGSNLTGRNSISETDLSRRVHSAMLDEPDANIEAVKKLLQYSGPQNFKRLDSASYAIKTTLLLGQEYYNVLRDAYTKHTGVWLPYHDGARQLWGTNSDRIYDFLKDARRRQEKNTKTG